MYRRNVTVGTVIVILLGDLCLAQVNQSTSRSCSPAISHAGGNLTLNCGIPRAMEGKFIELLNQMSINLNLMSDLQSNSSARRAQALERLSPIVSVATQYSRHHKAAVQRFENALLKLSQLPDEKEYEPLLTQAMYALEQGKPQLAKTRFDNMYQAFCPYGGAVPSICGHGMKGDLPAVLKAIRRDLDRLVELKGEAEQLTARTGRP